MKKDCPQCKKVADLTSSNIFRPFCSEKCKLIDFGTWTNEEKIISSQKISMRIKLFSTRQSRSMAWPFCT